MDPKLDHLKRIFRSLLLPETNGATIQQLRKLYLEMEGEEIPYKRFGFNTDIALLKTMDSVIHMRRDKYGNMKVFAEKSTESQHIANLVAGQRRKPKRPYIQLRAPRPRQRTQPPITRNKPNVGNQTNENTSNFGSFRTARAVDSPRSLNPPNSTKAAESVSRKQSMISNSTTLTKTESKQQKPIDSSAKPSVLTSFVETLTNLTISNNQNDKEDKHHENKAVEDKPLIVFDTPLLSGKAMNKSKGESDSEHSEELTGWKKAWYGDDQTQQTPVQKIQHEQPNIDDLFPVEIYAYSDEAIELNKIGEPKLDLTKFIIGTKLKICVSQTFNPYKFWFHIEDEIRHLDVLMENLAMFYGLSRTDPISKTNVPESYLKIGNICAVKFRDEWHRGKILHVGALVKIFFLDYGTVADVLQEDLRFLAKEFSKLPAFARRGVLDMVKPTSGAWTTEVLHFFENIMKYYQYQLLSATITNINEEELTVYFKLTDETQIPVYDVAENLIITNCAYATTKSLANFQSRHLNEIRPSFDMLESGAFPSIEEIFEWYDKKNFDWIKFDEMRLDTKYLGYETIE